MKSVNVTIDKLAELLAETLKADTDEDKELVVYILKKLVNNDEQMWNEIVFKSVDFILKS